MRVEPPDIEAWLTEYIRAEAVLAGHDLEVGNKEPDGLQAPLVRPLVVIRDDSGPPRDWVTFERSVGASVLAGTKAYDYPANRLGIWLASVLFDKSLPLVPGSPIVSVDWDGCNGPYPVGEKLDVARRYLTAKYVVSGSWSH
ncbi:hypothetical protein [Lysinibacter sp. HNR]|uniref:hypothetical protein n=1 Tax=Lysinibacter sp. HNR TaxID=3031408 RepID=UPI002434BBC4|nr:hypothetical protein [Lysinibacter sp. HNR]WGD38476.1 hypothetical protein FrondiHNR_06085 [Lysinibacter sp. HNR]